MGELRKLHLVAGISLSGMIPFWKKSYSYYISSIDKILISFYQIKKSKIFNQISSERDLKNLLKLSKNIKLYVDNGAFSFIKKGKFPNDKEYIKFIENVKPHWYPIPADFIPHPSEDKDIQFEKFLKTMEYNKKYMDKGYTPVIHAGLFFENFLTEIKKINPSPRRLAIGGLVPHMLLSKNGSREIVIKTLKIIRKEFPSTEIHVFGIGGITTVYLLKLANIDTFDTMGWRIRAVWGIIQIPGKGERQIVPKEEDKGWKIPYPDEDDWKILKSCKCPVCRKGKHNLLRKKNFDGFEARAIHNLYVISQEVKKLNKFKNKKSLFNYIEGHVKNKFILKLTERLIS